MEKTRLKERTKLFALKIMDLCENLNPTVANQIIGRQLIRCGTSVGANYRAAVRAKSQADFINKLKIVEEEADECMYFMELLKERNQTINKALEETYAEANEILAMVVASIKTTRKSKPTISSTTRNT